MRTYAVRFPGLLLFLALLSSSSHTGTLRGFVRDAVTLQPIARATVLLRETGKQQATDAMGTFSFEGLNAGRHTLTVHHIAYAGAERSIVVGTDGRDSVVFILQPAILESPEMVVRSSRTESALSATPYPVNIILPEELQHYAALTLPDALKRSPGLALVRDGAWETAISVRGMDRSNIVALVDNTRIETANDIAGALSLVNINDLERAETLKSPGSVLYGTGTLGGVVHLVTKRPSFSDQQQLSAEISGSVSSVDDCTSQYVALEDDSERYAVRLSGGHRIAGNTMTPLGSLPNSQFSDFSLTGSIGIQTGDDQTMFMSYQRSQAENTGIPGGSAIAASASARYTLARRELFSMEYTITSLSELLPLMTIRASHQEIDRNVEILQSPVMTLTPHATHTATSAQTETRLCPAGDQIIVVGIEAWERSLDSRRERIDKSKGQITGERPVPDSRFFSAGVYAQDEWSILPGQITLTSGVRYDWIRISNDETWNPEYVNAGGTLLVPVPNQHMLWNFGTARNQSWSADAGIRMAVTPLLDATFLVATAFRSPSLEERFQYLDLGNVVRLGNPNLLPEQSFSLNAGLRWHTETARIQGDVFLNNLTNLVTDVPGAYEGRSAYYKENIGKARLYGFEASYEQSITASLACRTSIACVRGENTFSHTDLPEIAPLDGQIEVLGRSPVLGTFSLSCSYAAAQNHLAAGELRTAGYAVYDAEYASAPLSIARCSLSLRTGVQNIFNRNYQNHLSTLRGLLKSEPGRNVYVSAAMVL